MNVIKNYRIVVFYSMVLSQNFPGGNKETQRILQFKHNVSKPRFKPGISYQNTNDVFRDYIITFGIVNKSFRCNLVEEKIHLNITGVWPGTEKYSFPPRVCPVP